VKTTPAKAILIATSLFFPLCCFAQTKSKEAAAYANSGIAKLKKHDFDGAIADFNRALQSDPKLAKVYVSRGLAKREKHDLDGAIADFNRALQLDPKNANAYYSRGNAKREKHELIAYGGVGVSPVGIGKVESGELDSVITDLDRALQLDPKNVKAYLNRGVAKDEKGDMEAAMQDYDRALMIDPKNPNGYNNRGNIKLSKGDLDGAMTDYNHALQLNPKYINAYYNRGITELLKRETDRAIADFNRALQFDPKDAITYLSRGNANFVARNWTGALRDYTRFCELSPRNQHYAYARFGIWMIRSRLGEREAADKELGTHFTAAPGSWVSKVEAYLIGGLSEADFLAAAASRNANTDRKQRCEAWFYAGMTNLLHGNKPAAVEFFRKCVETEGKSVIEYQFAKAELKTLGQ
jgi:tetratricopeptide (TPR) repeat protein